MATIGTLPDWLGWNLGPAMPRWQERLSDGTAVLVRPLRPADAERERILLEALSPESRRFRFLGTMAQPSPELLGKLTHPDVPREIALTATVELDGVETLLGVGRYATIGDGSECECAVVVRDDWQQRGVATLLMRHLMEVAKFRGVKRMWSMDAAANQRMAELAAGLGFRREVDPRDPTQVIHSLWLD